MAKLQKKGVTYNDIQPVAKTSGALLGYSPYVNENGRPINKYYEGYIQQPSPFINAVDLNWSNAVYGDTVINSTEDIIININNNKNDIRKVNNRIDNIQLTPGATGRTGAQGIQGIIGEQGYQGITGAQGIKGNTGERGITGIQGINGKQGTTGVQGTKGLQGILGTQGTNGKQGTTGAQGAIGATGTFNSSDLEQYATKQFVNEKVADLVDSAPGTLDTLNELASALGNDENFATTVASQIGEKYTKPNTGIPLNDLSNDVKSSLNLANSALQEAPVTSVNGMTGEIVLPEDILSNNYIISSESNNGLKLESGDTYEEAFSKIEKTIQDNEYTIAVALSNLDNRINESNESLSNVAKSGNYNDLIDTPTIPTKVSDLDNDSNYLTEAPVTSVNGMTGAVILPEAPVISVNGMTGEVVLPESILSNNYVMSNLTNDELALAGGDTYEEAFSKIEKTIQDNENITASALVDLNTRITNSENSLATVATSGSYNDLIDTPTIPTKVSDLNNDSNYLTEAPVTSVNGMTGEVILPESVLSSNYTMSDLANNELALESGDTYEEAFSKIEKTIHDNEYTIAASLSNLNNRISESEESLATVAISGSYNDLIDTPAIPTKVSDLDNDSNYLTEAPVTSVNGMTGEVVLPESVLSSNYAMSDLANHELALESGDTYEEAFGKIEKTIHDNEYTIAVALSNLDNKISESEESLATVAISGSYNDLIDTPVIPTKVSDLDNDSNYLTEVPVTSVNGMTGAVILPEAPVTSVNGMTGAVILPENVLSNNYVMSNLTNDELELEIGDTYEEAFGKIEKTIQDNEYVLANVLIELKNKLYPNWVNINLSVNQTLLNKIIHSYPITNTISNNNLVDISDFNLPEDFIEKCLTNEYKGIIIENGQSIPSGYYQFVGTYNILSNDEYNLYTFKNEYYNIFTDTLITRYVIITENINIQNSTKYNICYYTNEQQAA